MPFAAKVKNPVDIADLSREEIDDLILEAIDASKRGEYMDIDTGFEEILEHAK